MNYEIKAGIHRLALEKDEMISLVGLVFDGLEYNRLKAKSGDSVALVKNQDAEVFVRKFRELAMTTVETND